MTSIPAPDHGPRPRLVQTIGHISSKYLPAALLLMGLWRLISPRNEALDWIVTVVFCMAVTVGPLLNAFFHYGHLCVLCAKQAPLNGSAAAEKRGLWLRLHHLVAHPVRWLLLLTVAIAPGLIATRLGLPYRVEALISLFTFTLPLAAVGWSGYQHHRLYPWCPQCDWGGGGPKEIAVEPDPDPSMSR